MSRPHLSPCSACARHVRVSDVSCPFCGATLSESFRAQPAPRPPMARLNRAALYALGATSMAIAACTTSSEAVYGAPPIPVDSGVDGQSTTPLYGAPPADAGHDARPIVDSGGDGAPEADSGQDAEQDAESIVDSGGDGAGDASEDAEAGPIMVDAAYGGPPLDSGKD